jgi:hypothetical protein
LLFDFLSGRRLLPLTLRGLVASAIMLCAALTLSGCVTAPESAQAPAPTPAATQTVYVPVYVEVEKAAKPPTPVAVAPEPIKLPEDQEQSLALLAEIAKSTSSNGDELRKEYASAQAAFNRDKTLINRMRLTWYSALLSPSLSDDARLTALIEPMVAKIGGFGTTHPLRPIAELLLAQISERGRQVREQSKKVDELQQKLDALKAIEKQLLDRERRRN